MVIRGTMGVLVVGGLLAYAAGLFSTVPTSAAEKSRAGQQQPRASQQPQSSHKKSSLQAKPGQPDNADAPQARLNYVKTGWEKVLRNLAEDTGSQLVLHDLPPGRYTRTDFKKYSRKEAVRILNQELEPQGFRILEKGEYLTVLEMRRARSEFSRPVMSQAVEQAGDSAQPARFAKGNGGRPIEPLDELAQDASRSERSIFSLGDQLKHDRSVRQAGGTDRHGTDRSGEIITSSYEVADGEEGARPAATVVDPTFHPQHRQAVDIAKLLQTSFKDRSKLLYPEDGTPHNLPALLVFDSPETSKDWPRQDKQGVWFTVEIDTDRNSLVVSAAGQTTRGLINLMQRLDKPPVAGEPATRLISGSPSTMHIGRELQPELARLRQRQAQSADAVTRPHAPPGDQFAWQDEQRAPVPPAANQPGQPRQPAGPNAGPIAPGGPARVQDQLPAILSGLRGEVVIEALPDLNLMILRGNEQDIAQVEQIIARIEQLAEGSRPDIHLLFLQHINSIAVAALLNSLYTELEDLNNVNPLQSAQTVKVVPVGTPNAILILAPQAAMESILQLAAELDKPGDPQAEVEIFPLEYAAASQAKGLLDEFFAEPAENTLQPRVRVSADIRTNSLIVHARPNDLEEVRLIIRNAIDKGSSPASNQLRVIPLQNAAADELADFLNRTIQGILNPPQQTTAAGGAGFGGAATQGPEELRTPKSVVLEFLTTDGITQRFVRSGLLTDVRVTPDLRTNSLTVAAPKQTLELLIELIDILDQPAATVADIKVFPLDNADATTVVDLLISLFESDEEDALGIAIAGAEDASSSLIPLKFDADTRTNSIIAIGGLEALRIVEAILIRLDESNIRERREAVIKLHNSFAPDVALSIRTFIQDQLDLIQGAEDQISTKEIIDRTYIVVADEATNSLIISASPRYFDTIVRIIKELDAEPPQVTIQALLVEVDLSNTDEFGIELGFQDSVLFDRTPIDNILTTTTTSSNPGTGIQTTTQNVIAQTGVPGFLFNSPTLGNNLAPSANPSKVGTQGLSSFALGRTNNDLGFGGLVLSASSEAVSVLVRALQASSNARVLSRPQATVLNNQTALIQDGQIVPVIDGFNPSTAGLAATPVVRQQDVGLILEVTPRISGNGEVVMVVSAQKSALSGDTVPLVVDPITGAAVQGAIIDITLAQTTVKVNDGQTVVLGGIIVEEDFTLERKAPWLGDIPVLGQLFRYDANNHRRSELLVFLTPRIIYNDADFELIKQVETERIHFFEHEAEEIHGPLFSVPPASATAPPRGGDYGHEGQCPPNMDYVPGMEYPSEPTMPLEQYPLEGEMTFPNDPPVPFQQQPEFSPGAPEDRP